MPGLCVSTSWYTDSLHRNSLSRGRAFAFSAAFLQLGQGGSSGSVEIHGSAENKEGACVAGKGKAEHAKSAPGHSVPVDGHRIQGAQGCARLSC